MADSNVQQRPEAEARRCVKCGHGGYTDAGKCFANANRSLAQIGYIPCGCFCDYSGTHISHPEDFCHKCGRPNVVWFAPSSLWNLVVRTKGEPEMLCPTCFIRLAEEAGINGQAWKVEPESYVA